MDAPARFVLPVLIIVATGCAGTTSLTVGPEGSPTPTPSRPAATSTSSAPPSPVATASPSGVPSGSPTSAPPSGPTLTPGRTVLEIGDSATRHGDTMTVLAVTSTEILCYRPGPIADYTPDGCHKGDGSVIHTPAQMLIDIEYCVGAGNAAYVVADDDGIYAADDIFVGDAGSSTGLADGAESLYYGGEVSEHALNGTIAPGECQTGFLPFGGPAHDYLQWGDEPSAPDAAWWSLRTAAACPIVDVSVVASAFGTSFDQSFVSQNEQFTGCTFPLTGSSVADDRGVIATVVISNDCAGNTPCPVASLDQFQEFHDGQPGAVAVAGIGDAAYWYDAVCGRICQPPFGAPDPAHKYLAVFQSGPPAHAIFITVRNLTTDPTTWQAGATAVAQQVALPAP